MAYQAIVNYIRDIAKTVNETGSFIHGRRIDGSIEFAEPMPQIHLYPFISSINVADSLVETANVTLGFWFEDKPDSSNKEREEIIARADTMCKAFIQAMLDSDDPFQISNLRTEPQYQTFHATLSGYALSFTITTVESC